MTSNYLMVLPKVFLKSITYSPLTAGASLLSLFSSVGCGDSSLDLEVWKIDVIFLSGLWFNILVNSYGHVERFSWPNHTFFLSKLALSS